MIGYNKIINIIGQIRIYSLIDLILFAYAIGSTNIELLGIAFLHISFLFYLEYTHKHNYRLQLSQYVWIFFAIAGIALYRKVTVIGYIIASMLYVKKDKWFFWSFSPIARWLQMYFITAGIVGFLNPLSLLAFILLAIRNFTGDLRDVTKDKNEKMNTLPIILWFKKDYKNSHLLFLFITSFIWWYISGLWIIWLIGIISLQIATYNITTR